MEHVHSIIIIKKDNKFLNYYDERWEMYMFPNIKGNNIEEIKNKYNTENIRLLFDKVHEKYSVSHNEMRTYHHYFYQVDTDINGEYFSLEELLENPRVKKYNEDIINYINEYYNNE
ncbi:MAG: hypothetical protein IKG42_04615 [Clostridia bacterium]|nr:hypothetical protein [Clostridia bacterium]